MVAGRRSVALFNAANESAQLGNLLIALPNENDESGDEKYENGTSGEEKFKSPGERTDGFPGYGDIGNGQQAEEKISNSPHLALPPLKLRQAVADIGA